MERDGDKVMDMGIHRTVCGSFLSVCFYPCAFSFKLRGSPEDATKLAGRLAVGSGARCCLSPASAGAHSVPLGGRPPPSLLKETVTPETATQVLFLSG